MKISASFLSIKDNIKENIIKLDNTNIDYLHIDIMDGMFVPNKTWDIDEIKYLLSDTTKLKDVHLMVNDVKTYIDLYSTLKPEFISFHIEAVDDVMQIINYIKSKNIKVGLAIKPKTNIVELYKYLQYIDLVLIMSVEPGYGGQQFLLSTIDRVNKLIDFRKENSFNFEIEVDGGINNNTIKLIRNIDIAVVGSYITNNDYVKSVNDLKS